MTYSKSPHYNPRKPKAHEPDRSVTGNWDEISLVRSICVKVCQLFVILRFTVLNNYQERSSAKRKELYKTVQLKAGVSPQTQLLLDMKVWWSSTYVMVNRAESNRKVSTSSLSANFSEWPGISLCSMWIPLCMRWDCKSPTWVNAPRLTA